MKAEVGTGAVVPVGDPEQLFEGSWNRWDMDTVDPPVNTWDVRGVGEEFVFLREPGSETGTESGVPSIPVEVVVNWFTELRERMGN